MGRGVPIKHKGKCGLTNIWCRVGGIRTRAGRKTQGGFLDSSCLPHIGQGRPAPIVCDVSLFIGIPILGISIPYLLAQLLLESVVKVCCCFGRDLKTISLARLCQFNQPHKVVHLTLHHENNRVVPKIRIGSIEHAEVRKVRYEHAQIGLWALFPSLRE